MLTNKATKTIDIEYSIDNIGNKYKLNGRIIKICKYGKITFYKLLDNTGTIQLMLSNDICHDTIKLYDLVYVEGELNENLKKTDYYLRVNRYRILNKYKHLNQLQNKNYFKIGIGLQDRYFLEVYSKCNYVIRKILFELGYKEFSTSILSYIYNSGRSKPFSTYVNATKREAYLKATAEIELKKIIATGEEKVFEITHSFRNEGLDKHHLPDFQMLEIYDTNSTLTDMIEIVKIIVNQLFELLHLDVRIQWEEINIIDRILDCYNINLLDSKEHIYNKANSIGIFFNEEPSIATMVKKIINQYIEKEKNHNLILTNLPSCLSPLTAKSESNEKISDRFLISLHGCYICDISKEENDYDKLKKCIVELHNEGHYNNGLTYARDEILEVAAFGFPKMSGVGMSISRLVAAICNVADINDIALFGL